MVTGSSVEQKREPMDKNRIRGIRRRTSGQRIAKSISIKGAGCKSGADKRMLRLIGAFLKAGVMENGLVGPVDEGTPKAGLYRTRATEQ